MDIGKYKSLLEQRAEIEKQICDIESKYNNTKLYYISGYIVDTNNDFLSLDEILSNIENRADVSIVLKESKESDLLWHDDIDINMCGCPIESYEAYFENQR